MNVTDIRRGFFLFTYLLEKFIYRRGLPCTRLARDVYISEVIRRAVAKAGGTIETVDGTIDASDKPEERLRRQILAAFAEYERAVIAARTKAAMLRHQRNGKRMSDETPYGWMRDPEDDKAMVANDNEQDVIDQIRDRSSAGEGLRAIARALDKQGIKPRSAQKWSHQTVKAILKRSTG